MLQSGLHWGHRGLSWLIVVGLAAEVYLAGAPLFGATTFEAHRSLGDALGIAILVLLVLGLAARSGRRIIGLSILLVALTIIQVSLPSLRNALPWVAALHALNAVALLGVAASVALAVGRGVQVPRAVSAPAISPSSVQAS